MSKTHASPDSRHRAALHYEGEIRFGPAYYRLSVNGRPIPGAVFGDKLFWSPDSKLLAAEQWLTTKESDGPSTRLLLVDVEAWTAAAFRPIERGFVRDVRFSERGLSYVKDYPGSGRSEAEVEYAAIGNWSSIGSERWEGG